MEDIKETRQKSAEYLANTCLLNAEEYHNYSNKDLGNASIIFTHFLIDKIWEKNQELPQGKREELAEKTGKAIRQLIQETTGLDMHDIVKE